MTIFVTNLFPTPSDRPATHELVDKNRPATLFNYLTHTFGMGLSGKTLKTTPCSVVSTSNHSLSVEILEAQKCPVKLSGEIGEFVNFNGQVKRVKTALNPFKPRPFYAFKRPLNVLKICQTVL